MIKLPSMALANSLMIAYFQDVNTRKLKRYKDGKITKRFIKILALAYIAYIAAIIFWRN